MTEPQRGFARKSKALEFSFKIDEGRVYIFMISFEEWLIEKHPEILDEINFSRAVAPWILAAGSFMGNQAHADPVNNTPQAPATAKSNIDQNYAKRREIVQLESDNSSFKKEWGKHFTKKDEIESINVILSLKTVEQHEHFIKILEANMDKIVESQTKWRSTPETYKSDKARAMKIYDYQKLLYFKKLATASKFSLEINNTR